MFQISPLLQLTNTLLLLLTLPCQPSLPLLSLSSQLLSSLGHLIKYINALYYYGIGGSLYVGVVKGLMVGGPLFVVWGRVGRGRAFGSGGGGGGGSSLYMFINVGIVLLSFLFAALYTLYLYISGSSHSQQILLCSTGLILQSLSPIPQLVLLSSSTHSPSLDPRELRALVRWLLLLSISKLVNFYEVFCYFRQGEYIHFVGVLEAGAVGIALVGIARGVGDGSWWRGKGEEQGQGEDQTKHIMAD